VSNGIKFDGIFESEGNRTILQIGELPDNNCLFVVLVEVKVVDFPISISNAFCFGLALFLDPMCFLV
jgi:hypothetical protein